MTGCRASNEDVALELPIRFEHGFSLTKQFTVKRPKRYRLVVAFHKHTPIELTASPPDDFTAEFRIASDGVTITEGTNDSNPRHPALLAWNYTERWLAVFDAQPGKTYELSFLITQAASSLVSTKPVVIIREKTDPAE